MEQIIDCAKDKLQDIFIMNWAIDRYKAAKKYRVDLVSKMEHQWFDNAILQYWFDHEDQTVLARLMQHLPATHFSGHIALIAEGWKEWTGKLAQYATPLLPEILPETHLSILEDYIKNDFTDLPKQLAVIRLLPQLHEESREKFRSMIESQIIKLENNDHNKEHLIIEFIRFDGVTSRNPDYLMKLAQNYIIVYSSDEDSNYDIFQALAKKLFSTNALFIHAMEILEIANTLSFESLQPFFAVGAPLKKCDTLLSSTQPWVDTIKFLQDYKKTTSEILPLIEAVQSHNDVAHHEFAAFVIAAILDNYHLETIDTDTLSLEKILVLLSWEIPENPHIPTLTDALGQLEPEIVGAAINELMPQLWEKWGGIQLATLAGELRLANTLPILIKSISNEQDDYLCEAASTALNLLGEPAQQAIITQWDSLDRSQKIYGIDVIKNSGGQPALDFAIDHFNEFVNLTNDLEMWLELVKAVPDKSSIRLLEPEIRRKHPFIDETFYILCKLTGYDFDALDDLFKRVLEAYKKRETKMAELLEGNFASFESESISLPLKCDKCGEVNHYDIKSVFASQKATTDMFCVKEEFPCLDCGQWPDFELTEDANRMVMARSMLQYKFSENQEDEELLDFTKAQYRFQIRPIPDILAELKRDIAQHPESLAYLLRFARFQAIINRPHRASEYYRKALELESYAIEAAVGLAQTQFNTGMEHEAYNTLSQSLKHKEKWKFFRPHEVPEEVVLNELVLLYNELREVLKPIDMPILSPASLKKTTGVQQITKKIGRNAPCPCGSGKKYKKCCL